MNRNVLCWLRCLSTCLLMFRGALGGAAELEKVCPWRRLMRSYRLYAISSSISLLMLVVKDVNPSASCSGLHACCFFTIMDSKLKWNRKLK